MEAFNLIKVLGHGTYGKVYLAEREGKEYAIKEFLPMDFVGMPCPTEVSLSLSLKHPCIVPAHEFFSFQDKYYLVMDKADCDLGEYMKKTRPSPKGIISLCLDIIQAMNYIHKSGFCHCDIKPGNLLMFGEKVKISDFGLSFYYQATMDYEITFAFSPPETLCNSSPEELLFSVNLPMKKYFLQKRNYRLADIWSVGVTFVYLLTGKHLFGVHDKTKTINHMASYFYHRERYLREFGIPREWIPLLSFMLHPCVEKRLSNLEDILTFEPFTNKNLSLSQDFYSWPILHLSVKKSSEIDNVLSMMDYVLQDYNVLTRHSSLTCFYYLYEKVEEKELELLAMACLLLFSKIYEIYVADERDLFRHCKKFYTVQQLVDMEWRISSLLDHRLYFLTLPILTINKTILTKANALIRDYEKYSLTDMIEYVS